MHRFYAGFSRRAFQLCLLAMLGAWVLPASANGLTPKDQKQIIEVVQAQLNAFAKDDAARAYAYATPSIQHMVGSAQNFLAMVRTQYEVVYRPSSTSFMLPSGNATEAELKVQLTDADGDAWIATYVLQRQKNKTWRIAACAVAQATGTMI